MLNRFHNILLFIFLFLLVKHLSFAQSEALEIWQIQGDGNTSSYQGQRIATAPSVITAIGDGFFFLQSPDAQADQDPLTSNGIYVAAALSANRKIGDLIQVGGIINEIDGRTQIGPENVSISLVEIDHGVPKSISLSLDFPSGVARAIHELEALEGMRVQFSGITTGPSDWRDLVPVVARTERPFREPGIRYPGLSGLPVWDDNPERFWLLPNALGLANNRFISAKTSINATGVLFQAEDDYILFPDKYSLGSEIPPRPVRMAQSNEITIASLNARRLDGLADNFDNQVKKIARYVVEMLHTPNLIALQEVGSINALNTLIFFIKQLDPEIAYTPFLLEGNDDFHVAFLVQESVFQQIRVEQQGKQESLSGGGVLFDRPPLLFSANLAGTPDINIQVLNLHLRSLLGIEGNNEAFVRKKRYEQSLAVAEMVQNLRNENLLVVGDFNAFQFTDGYVDVINQISGNTSLGAQSMIRQIVSPPLRKLAESLPLEEQYSFVFQGSAQLLDHALANNFQGLEIKEMIFARANADFPDAYAPNPQVVQRASDHDSFVLFLENTQPSANLEGLFNKTLKVYPNPINTNQPLSIETPMGFQGILQLFSNDGKIHLKRTWEEFNNQLYLIGVPAGFYHLYLNDKQHRYSKKIVVLPED